MLPGNSICLNPNFHEFQADVFSVIHIESPYPEFAARFGLSVPDYRGMFLRGFGEKSLLFSLKKFDGGIAIGASVHGSGQLGEFQGDAIRNILGTIPVILPINAGSRIVDGGSFSSYITDFEAGISGHPTDDADTESLHAGATWFSAGNMVPVAEENRPANVAVKWLIRVL